jgi:tetratricopeptide (TPR) repeat protein
VLLLRQVLEWNPDRTESHRLLASAWYDLGAMEQAIVSLDQVIRLEPNDFRPHYMKATILRDFERFEDASIAFKEAVDRAPAGKPVADEIRSAWGDCLIRLRRYDDALKVLEPAGEWPEVLAWRSQACFSLRRFDDAQRLADQALSKEPLQPEALLVAAMTRERSGDARAAIQMLKDGLKKSPNELRYHHRLADFYGAVGDVEAATLHRNRAGEIAELRSKFSAAHQAMVRDTGTAAKRLELARLAEALGETEMARSWFFAALSLAPEDTEIKTAWQQFQDAHPEPVAADSLIPPQRPAGEKPSTSAFPSEF